MDTAKAVVSMANKIENKYIRDILCLDGTVKQIDIYRVLDAYKVTSPQLQHLAKKALCAGLRGYKDTLQDLLDIRESIDSAILMHEQNTAWENKLIKGE